MTRLAETLKMIQEAEDFVGEVILATEWVQGFRGTLRKMGFELRFWHGVHDHIERDWVTITRTGAKENGR